MATYTVNMLMNIKLQHERDVSDRFKKHQCGSKQEVARLVHPLLAQNHAVFKAYGPHSEIARKNPESEAHSVWLEERLATIVPNNLRISELVSNHSRLFTPDEQKTIAEFETHARGYERWVKDETTYEGVVRFPVAFDALITELARA